MDIYIGDNFESFYKKNEGYKTKEMWVRLLKKTERRGNKKRTFDTKLDWTGDM